MDYFPILVEKLPSKGIPYKGIKEIEIRGMTVAELKKWSSATSNNGMRVINSILKNCVQGIDVNELTVGDKLNLIIRLRIDSFGNSYIFDWECNNCKKENTNYKFNLDEVKINYLKEDYYEPMKIKIMDTIIGLRLMRVKDDAEIERYLELNKNEEEWILNYSVIIENENFKTLKDKVEFVSSLPVSEFNVIRGFVEEYHHGIDENVEVVCLHCGSRRCLQLPFQPELLFPKARDTINFRDRICNDVLSEGNDKK